MLIIWVRKSQDPSASSYTHTVPIIKQNKFVTNYKTLLYVPGRRAWSQRIHCLIAPLWGEIQLLLCWGDPERSLEKKKEMKIHCNYINCRHAAEFMTCIFIMKWLIETGNLTLPLSHSCSFCSTHLKIYCLNFQYIGWNIRELLTIVSCYSLKLYSYSSYLNTNFYSLTYIILPSPFQPKWITSILTV